MNDYTKQLEEQNEELKQALAKAQLKMPEWITIDSKDADNINNYYNIITCYYVLGDKTFGYYEYNTTIPGKYWGKTKMGTFEIDIEQYARRTIEEEFVRMFNPFIP